MSDRSRSTTAGLWLLGICSALDLAVIGVPDGPPLAVGIVSAVLGVASLWLVVRSMRDAHHGLRLLAGLRVLSALSAVPAFVADDASGTAIAAAAVTVVLNVAGLLLVSGPGRTAALAR
jgi:hypothetical protein